MMAAYRYRLVELRAHPDAIQNVCGAMDNDRRTTTVIARNRSGVCVAAERKTGKLLVLGFDQFE
jgi:hypothetical protein